jgi:Regulator of chromosome condensation (RCC1) repeat
MKPRRRMRTQVAAIAVIGFLAARYASAQDHAVAGQNSTCVVSAKNSLTCAGASVGNGDASVPHFKPSVPNGIGVASAVALSIFNNYVCAINSDGAIWCWSSDGIKVPFRIQTPQVPHLPIVNAKSIGVGAAGVPGGWDACALLPNSFGIACWRFDSSSATALNLNDIVDATGNVLYGFGCAVRGPDSAVFCWGQANVASSFPFASPQTVLGLSKVTTVSAGYMFSCAALADASVKCWGQNKNKKLGASRAASKSAYSPTPVPVNLGPGKPLNYAVVSAGHDHACASGTYGSVNPPSGNVTGLGLLVKCWGGNNFYGQNVH